MSIYVGIFNENSTEQNCEKNYGTVKKLRRFYFTTGSPLLYHSAKPDTRIRNEAVTLPGKQTEQEQL